MRASLARPRQVPEQYFRTAVLPETFTTNSLPHFSHSQMRTSSSAASLRATAFLFAPFLLGDAASAAASFSARFSSGAALASALRSDRRDARLDSAEDAFFSASCWAFFAPVLLPFGRPGFLRGNSSGVWSWASRVSVLSETATLKSSFLAAFSDFEREDAVSGGVARDFFSALARFDSRTGFSVLSVLGGAATLVFDAAGAGVPGMGWEAALGGRPRLLGTAGVSAGSATHFPDFADGARVASTVSSIGGFFLRPDLAEAKSSDEFLWETGSGISAGAGAFRDKLFPDGISSDAAGAFVLRAEGFSAALGSTAALATSGGETTSFAAVRVGFADFEDGGGGRSFAIGSLAAPAIRLAASGGFTSTAGDAATL